ncbi:MAG: hypothetical protein K2X80_17140 [Pseudomonadaceae bacterium]|nr:hypothetical protein [Pseudomonadaceae bacterium]
MDGIETLNQAFFLSINAGVDTSTGLINLAMGIANELILVVPLLLLGMWLWGDAARRNLALKSCIVVFLGLGLNQLIGLAWQHPRPFVLGLGHTFMSHSAETSFPSDHLTVFAGLGLTWLLGDLLVLGVITLLAGLAVA